MPAILILHSYWRWVVLVVAAVTIVKALIGWFGRQPWARLDDQLGMFFTIAIDIQVLIGLILYIIERRWTMPDPFFAYIHPLVMIIALILAHIGRSRVRKLGANTGNSASLEIDVARHRTSAIFYAISFLLIVAAIPWSRPLFR
jgi:hypothetical protein